MDLLMDERLMTLTAWDVNVNGARMGLVNDAVIHRRWLTAY